MDGLKDALILVRKIDKNRIISPQDVAKIEQVLSDTIKDSTPARWTKRATALAEKKARL